MKGKLRMSPYRKAREELLSGRTSTRIQAMADLEAAIRADQRRIDQEQLAAAEARLRVARFTAEHWRDATLMSEHTRIGAHPCAMILAALDGETDPVQCGIEDWAKDAFRAVVAGEATPDRLSKEADR